MNPLAALRLTSAVLGLLVQAAQLLVLAKQLRTSQAHEARES